MMVCIRFSLWSKTIDAGDSNTSSVRDDKDTMDVLKQVVGSMKGSFSEAESERLLKEILSEPKKEGTRVP